MRRLFVALLLVFACAVPRESAKKVPVPYLHPTARVVFPESILDLPASRIHKYGPTDIAAHYAEPGLDLTVFVYPADTLEDPSVESHFQEALRAIGIRYGIDKAERFELRGAEDLQGSVVAATFEIDQPLQHAGILSVHQACSHIAKFRITTDATVDKARRLEVLAAAIDAVIPPKFVIEALSSLGDTGCQTTFLEGSGEFRVSSDGCTIYWDPNGGSATLYRAMCAALDARVRAN